MTGRIEFVGRGPFQLPAPSQVAVTVEPGGHIVLALQIVVGELGSGHVETIRVPLVENQAFDLAAEMSRAAARAIAEHHPPAIPTT
ncbi:MAG: hypothetical protein FJX61_10385 [Alphaproteobacteria bacterium]|nr:hypothetical protein [Alphaproteobacteria bacterium]